MVDEAVACLALLWVTAKALVAAYWKTLDFIPRDSPLIGSYGLNLKKRP